MKGKVRLGGCAGRSRHHTRHHLADVDVGDGSALAARGAEGGELLFVRRPERLHLLPRHRLLSRLARTFRGIVSPGTRPPHRPPPNCGAAVSVLNFGPLVSAAVKASKKASRSGSGGPC